VFVAAPSGSQEVTLEAEDAQVLKMLAAAGADLSKEHLIDFFLVASTKQQAKALTTALTQRGYRSVRTARDHKSGNWGVHVTRNLIPTLDAMVNTTRDLEDLAKSFGGTYDGWGAMPVK
jgi:hypothetical protein